MKILFVTDLYPLINDDSIPKAIEDFVLAFRDEGKNVFILRPNFLPNSIIRGHKVSSQGVFYEDGVKIYNRNFFLPFLNDDISYLDEKYDLIISHMPSGHIYADLINKKLNLPHISILHQSDWRVLDDFKYSFYFKKRLLCALNNSTIIGARNKFLSEKSGASFVLPSFVQSEKIVLNKKIKEDKLRIITLSKLIKRKNIDLVILALSKVKFDFEYSIYGKGKEYKRLSGLIRKYNLQDKIKIYPHINHDFIWEKLDENDVFILPSSDETFGISYLEALCRGLIVIGTKNTGIDGVIEDNKNGFLINPEVDEIKEILEKIHQEDMTKIVENSLLNIQNYTREKIMNKYNEIIKKIL